LLILYGVSDAVDWCFNGDLLVLSTWFSVMFSYVAGESSAGRRISKEEGEQSFSAFFYYAVPLCVLVLTRVIALSSSRIGSWLHLCLDSCS